MRTLQHFKYCRWLAPAAIALVALLTISSTARAEDGMSKNLEIVKSIYAAFERGDVEAAVVVMDDDVQWVTPGPATIPFAGTFKGKEGVRRFFTIAVDLLTIREQRINEYVTQNDKVVALGYEDLEVKADGRSYRSTWAHVYTLRHGKVVKFEEFVDTAAQAAAFSR